MEKVHGKMSEDGLEIDKIDKRIINMLQDDPNATHMKIAKEVGLSQPSIGNRIKKLEALGILDYQVGVNLRTSNLLLARVDLHAKNPEKILKLVNKCPFMPIGFKLSGPNNISMLAVGPDLKFLERLVNTHFRNDETVETVSYELINELSNDFILPVGLQFDQCDCNLIEECSEGENE